MFEPQTKRRRRKSRRGLFLLRFVLLGALIAAVGIISFLLWFGGGGATPPEPEAEVPAADLDEDVVVSGRDIDRTVYQGGQPLFRVEGKESSSDRYGNVLLNEARLHLYRDDGEYQLEGQDAKYNEETQDARLDGAVKLRTPDELELLADWLELFDGGQKVRTANHTRFFLSDRMTGEAGSLLFDLEKGLYTLSHHVTLESTPASEWPFSLDADRIVYQKSERLIDADGEVELTRGAETLSAREISLYLDELADEVRYVRALWNVRGNLVAALVEGQPVQDITFNCWSLTLLLEPLTGNPTTLELEGRRSRRATIRTEDAQQSRRSLAARYLKGSFRDGALATVEALGPVTLNEELPTANGPHRRVARGRTGEAQFDTQGQLVRLSLEEEVEIEDGGVTASGDRGFFQLGAGRATLQGQPVVVESEEGEMRAPVVHFNQTTNLMHAEEGVRTLLKTSETTLPNGLLPLGGETSSDEPVRVESQEAFLFAGNGEFTFKGKVRAWQGKNLLLADQLRGNETQLAAAGGVKTIWHPRASEKATAEDEDVPLPIEISADQMTYSEPASALLFGGHVLLLQAGRTLVCNELQVDLEEQSTGALEAQRLRCTGKARLLDPAFDRTLEANRAVYDLDRGEIEFFGTEEEPLIIVDAQGEVRGPEAHYHLEEGWLHVGPRNPAQEDLHGGEQGPPTGAETSHMAPEGRRFGRLGDGTPREERIGC